MQINPANIPQMAQRQAVPHPVMIAQGPVPVLLIPQVELQQMFGNELNQVNFLQGATTMDNTGIKSMGGSMFSSNVKPIVVGDITTPSINQGSIIDTKDGQTITNQAGNTKTTIHMDKYGNVVTSTTTGAFGLTATKALCAGMAVITASYLY